MLAKLVILYCFLTVVTSRIAIPPELQEFIADLHNGCVKKVGVSEEDIKSYVNSNKDPKMMCYMKCLMLDAQWMAPDGTIRYDFISSHAHPDVKEPLIAALNQCKEIADGSHECEKSYNFHVCMSKADPENWILL